MSSLCRSFSMALWQNCTFVCLSKQCEATGVYKDIRSKCTSLYDLNAMHGKNFFIDSCSVLYSSTVELCIAYVCVSNECYNLFNMQSLSYKRYTFYHTHIFHFMHCICTFHTLIFNTYQFGQVVSACLPACFLACWLDCLYACMHACTNIKRKPLISRDSFSISALALPAHRFFTHSIVQCAIAFSLYHFSLDFSCCYFAPCVFFCLLSF